MLCPLRQKGRKIISQSQSLGFIFLIIGSPTHEQVAVWKSLVSWLFTTQVVCYCSQILRLAHRILFNTKMKLLFLATKNVLWLHQKPTKHVDMSSCKILTHSTDRRQWWSRCWPCRHAKETLPQSTFKTGSFLCLHSSHIARSALACHGRIYI